MPDKENGWIEHYNDGWPKELHPHTIVQVQMEIDGEILSPMRADRVDWEHDDDPVCRYIIVRVN